MLYVSSLFLPGFDRTNHVSMYAINIATQSSRMTNHDQKYTNNVLHLPCVASSMFCIIREVGTCQILCPFDHFLHQESDPGSATLQ